MSDTRPIGVFDSGVGGISVLAQLRRLMPAEDFVYYSDCANAPYGTRPAEEISLLVDAVVAQLQQHRIKALVIACNTATAAAAAELRDRCDFPVIGMEPALKPAHLLRRQGRILVLATPATLGLPKFARLMERYGEGAEPLPCPGLMELVEAEDFDGAAAYVCRALSAYPPDGVDAVVLGCTHYVFLRSRLQTLLPAHIALLDGNLGTARQLRRVLTRDGLLRGSGVGGLTLLTSGDPETVLPRMWRLLSLAEEMLPAEAETPADPL